MSCCKNIRACNVMAIVILIVMEQGAAETERVLLEDLPVTKGQLGELASHVCSELFNSEEKDQQANITSCIESFLSPARELSAPPSPTKVEIKCRTEAKQLPFEITPSSENQLIILVPQEENETILYKIISNYSNSDIISVQPNVTYALWSTILNSFGTRPRVWHRGPDVKAFPNVTIEEPIFDRNNETYERLNVTFKWSFVSTVDACREDVIITNTCTGDDSNTFFDAEVKADMPQSVTIQDLPLENECSFTVFKNGVRFTKDYNTTLCEDLPGCIPPPDKPENIYIEASEDGSEYGWQVFVSWLRPKFPPDSYNVTLLADGVHNVVLSGDATEVTFDNVTGAGLYNVSVDAISARGKQFTTTLAFFPRRGTSSMGVIMAGAWSGMLLAAAALVGLAICYRRRQANLASRLYFMGLEESLQKECSLESGQDCVVEDRWEVRSERLLLHEVIGEGAFGVVRRGTLAPAGKQVAVKMLKDFPTHDEIRSFREEMELMKSVGAHPHVVSLVGCCSGRRPLIVAEYCSRGDLLSFLRCAWDVMVSKRNAKYYNNNLDDYRNDLFKKPQKDHSKLVVNKLYDLQGVCDAELTSLDLLSFCRQIVMGMEFLASNRVVHRDLAARNILVAGDRTMKIADFGLSRDVYQENQYKQKRNGKMPVKWMALESLTHRIYTIQSDVWSFGVVIWEVVTLGGVPYPDLPAARLPRLLRAGYRMPRPNNCSKQLYEVMLSCWRARPRDRPSFAELHYKLDELLNSACADEYLSLELDADEAPPTPKAQRYVKMLLRGNRVWARGESYERPLKAPQSNHYTSPPAPLSRPQAV